VRGPEETGISVLRMEAKGAPVFFEMHLKFAANGNDFYVVIANFGIGDKTLAGSHSPLVQRKFSPAEIRSIKQRLEEYFSGPEEKKFVPFSVGGGCFLGVEFADRWIVENRQQ
jgi:hypothetical protein